jgi:hypothetical protein
MSDSEIGRRDFLKLTGAGLANLSGAGEAIRELGYA